VGGRAPVPLTREQLATLGHWFLPERPGPLIAQHVIATGFGGSLADRWPGPRALVVETGGNYTLAGDPGALDPEALRGRVAGFVDAPASFEPLLAAAAGELHVSGSRGQGLSTACAGAVCQDARDRGHLPSWTTSPDNAASLRVAAKLGFTLRRRDRLLVAGVPVPVPSGRVTPGGGRTRTGRSGRRTGRRRP
jgi:GNAT superfamily N-acetyltransferase